MNKNELTQKEKDLIVKALLTEINSYNSYKNLEFVEREKIEERQEELLKLIKKYNKREEKEMNEIYKNMKNIQGKLLVYIYEMEQGQKENVNLEELRELLHLSCGEV